ncbi:Tox-REase-5 domain-containing protein [Herbaspirillum seropedicae]|uniref:Tox-REase-5 domain-containing protein n=1 Tax=Herbaspirillum seropedicae TaxID=964 RepID=UPI003D998AAD
MIALIIPAAGEILTWLGIGATAGGVAVAGDEVLKRHREAEDAQSSPLAKTEVATKTREKCKDCPPSAGARAPVPHSMSQASRDYQAFITKFPPGIEWIYRDRDFDGFQEQACLLQEAKAYYTNFFNEDTLKPEPWWLGTAGYNSLLKQAKGQHQIVAESLPARLRWYFLEHKMQLSMARIFAQLNLTRIETEWAPW